MPYEAKFKGWSSLTIEDLLIAYRKAKADCFFENTFPTSIKFAEYEQDLLANLEQLMKQLKNDSGFKNSESLLGGFRLLPKKLSIGKINTANNGHIHFSQPEKAVERMFKNHNITPEFRIIGDFPVDMHVISALWINTVGHKFDARLNESCYGARLKRVQNDDPFSNCAEKPFHISSIGSFSPYFQPYQKWRNDGLKAIRDELEKDRNIIAVSLDLKSYYHFIDPLILSKAALLEELGLELDDAEKGFTKQLADFLNEWSKKASKFGQLVGGEKANISGGLVIGLTCSRIISNTLLQRWDKLILEKLSPIHYGRYVDDMFLVLRDTGTINNSLELMQLLQTRMGKECISENSEGSKVWDINQGKDIQGESKISLQSNKQKLFILQGRAGLDLLDSIEKEINELSSEHRFMPSPDQLERSTAAKALSAAGSVGESADTLRRADGLTIRRLGWSLQLRHVETLARDLPPNQWKEQREEFYQFAHNHILRADNLFAYFNYLPRLLGFAISMNEWEQAERIAVKSYLAIDTLASKIGKSKEIRINGGKAEVLEDLWSYIKGTLTWLFIDAAIRYYDLTKLSSSEDPIKKKHLADLFLNKIATDLASFHSLLKLPFNATDFEAKSPLVASADLAKEAYKHIVSGPSAKRLAKERNSKKEKKILDLLGGSGLLNRATLVLFIRSTRKTRLSKEIKKSRKRDSYLPYLFPTRPLSPAEISELAPECVGLPSILGKAPMTSPAVTWAKYTQVLRGVWIKPTLLATEQDTNDNSSKKGKVHLRIGTDSKDKLVVALTNLRTEDSDWAATACDKPNLSRRRYQQISNLVNDSLKLNPKPDYVLFPELSIPLRWLDSIAAKLSAAGISLIAGTEYRHSEGNKILSEAALVLADNRLGYPTFVKIWQPKLEPAVGEDKELIAKFGKEWSRGGGQTEPKSTKPVYIHNGVSFGVMICSELQNSIARIEFQGAVDALMVLSWNRDLETFASLIESATLDIHAYTILVNNRKYGDSRVRSPARESFLRDIARLRGGDNDFVVAATLDIAALRDFQSRAKRWPEEDDKFKPVPEGFEIDGNRKRSPPR